MAIELKTTQPPPYLYRSGVDDIDLAAGQVLKIETSPGGEELLLATVPAGKQWTVRVAVEVFETDA